MKKIPTIYLRDMTVQPPVLTETPNPLCLWVFAGEGAPTRKRDGTATMVDDSLRLWKRYDAKHGKLPPPIFMPCQEPDPITGHWPGWVPVTDAPCDRWYHEAPWPTEPGTYELCGPAFNGNPERLRRHTFFRHGAEVLDMRWSWPIEPQDMWCELEEWYSNYGGGDIEGVVWHHPDGRMAKIKASDFGSEWRGRSLVNSIREQVRALPLAEGKALEARIWESILEGQP